MHQGWLPIGLALLLSLSDSGAYDPDCRPPAGPEAAAIAWEPDFDLGLKKAKDENRPVMVAFILKGEAANDEVCRSHFQDPGIIEASRKFVCLVACMGIHADKDESPCPSLAGISCQDHARVDFRARHEYMGSPTVSAPQFLFLMPDGKTPLLRHVWFLSKDELRRKILHAFAYFDPSSAPPGFADHRDRVTRLLEEGASDHMSVRRSAVQTLAKLDDPRVTEFLIRQTGAAADTQKRLEAIFYMRDRGNAKVLNCLHDLLKAQDSQTRMYAAVALHGIGMQESAPHLAKALKKEDKERVRSHLIRALAACCNDDAMMRDAVLGLIKSTSQGDRIAGLIFAASLKRDADIDDAVLKAATATNNRVRCAGYYAIGSLELEKGKPILSKRVGSEREMAKAFCHWALEALGGPAYEGEIDPASEVLDWLPDRKMYEGELE